MRHNVIRQPHFRIQRIKVRGPSPRIVREPVNNPVYQPIKPEKITGGLTAVCMASGPSLTQSDVDAVKAWREKNEGLVIVTNTTFKLAPWADCLYAMDLKWWNQYAKEVRDTFRGKSYGPYSRSFDSLRVTGVREARARNSGAGAIMLARAKGATTIILLGYDAKYTGGKTHWHGNHPSGLGNARSVVNWPKQFRDLAAEMARIDIINCSRETILNCWPRKQLESVLV